MGVGRLLELLAHLTVFMFSVTMAVYSLHTVIVLGRVYL